MRFQLTTLLPLATLLSSTAAALHARAIDPQTLDPARLSILKVLRTVIPTGADGQIALPTGTVAPVWYTGLPAEIVSILPSLYPETTAVSSSSSSAAFSSSPSPTASSSSSAAPSKSVLASPTSQVAPLATGNVAAASNATGLYNGTGTLPGSSASPSAPAGYYSAGSRNPVGVGILAGMLWVGLGAGFFAFA